MDKLIFLDIPLFKDLDRIHKARILSKIEQIEVPKGTRIFEEGQFGDCLYIIVLGAVRIVLGEGSKERTIAVLREKEAFGEMALLTGEPRSAAAITDIDTVLLRLDKETFDRLLKEHNEFAVQFAGILARRLSQVNRQGEEKKEEIHETLFEETETESIERKVRTVEEKEHRMREEQERENNNLQIYKKSLLVLFACLVGIGSFFVLQVYISPNWSLFFGIFLAGSMLVGFRILSTIYATVCMVTAVVLIGGYTPMEILTGFSSKAWLLAFALALVGYSVVQIGVFHRILLIVASRVSQDSRFYSFTLRSLSVIGSFFIPPLKPREELLTTVLPDESKRLIVPMTSFLFLHSSLLALFAFGLLPAKIQDEITLIMWFLASMPLVLLIILFDFVFTKFNKKDIEQEQKVTPRRIIEEQLGLLGPVKMKEIISILVVLIIMVSFWLLPVAATTLYWIFACCLAFLAIISVVQEKSIKMIPYKWFLTFGLLIGYIRLWGAIDTVLPWADWPRTILLVSLFCTVTTLAMFLPNMLAFMFGYALFGEVIVSANVNPLIVLFVGLSATVPFQRQLSGFKMSIFPFKKIAMVGIAIIFTFPVWHVMGLMENNTLTVSSMNVQQNQASTLRVLLPGQVEDALLIRRSIELSKEFGILSDMKVEFYKEAKSMNKSVENVLDFSFLQNSSSGLNEASTIDQLLESIGNKNRIALYYTPDPYGYAFARALEQVGKERGTVITDRVAGPLYSTELSKVVNRWTLMGTEIIIVYDPFNQLSDSLMQLMAVHVVEKQALPRIALVGSDFSYLKWDNETVIGEITLSLGSNDGVLPFIQAYKARYGNFPNEKVVRIYEALVNWEHSK